MYTYTYTFISVFKYWYIYIDIDIDAGDGFEVMRDPVFPDRAGNMVMHEAATGDDDSVTVAADILRDMLSDGDEALTEWILHDMSQDEAEELLSDSRHPEWRDPVLFSDSRPPEWRPSLRYFYTASLAQVKFLSISKMCQVLCLVVLFLRYLFRV